MKTGSESIKANMCWRRILFTEFVARMEDMACSRCPNVTGRAKERIAQNKRARTRAGSLAVVIIILD